MSSASSGRYQSRLFNFVHQQSRRLKEQCERAFREFQVATSWVAPVVLYPIYLLFRSTRAGVKQVHQAVQQSGLQLQADDRDSQPQTPPTADTPIQRVLLLVDALPSSEVRSQESGVRSQKSGVRSQGSEVRSQESGVTTQKSQVTTQKSQVRRNNSSWLLATVASLLATVSSPLTGRSRSPKLNRPVIRGIATQLSSRTLVLVTAENEILEILTPQQQQKLQERITEEVGEYWRYQRLAHSARLHLPIEQGELILYPYQALAFLDRTFAQLESNYLAPVSEVAIALGFLAWELVGRLQSQLNISRKSPAIAADGSDTHTFRIQALIRAAINYFFGDRGGSELTQTTPTNSSLQLPADSKPRRKPLPHRHSASKLPDSQVPSRPQLQSPDVDPWLTMGDLFGDAESEGEPSTKSQTPTKLAGKTNPALPTSQSAWGGHPARHLRNLLNNLGLPTPYSPLPKSPQRDRFGEISHQPRSQSTQLDPAPDWVETKATAVGYVKHPLEQLLEWLDRAMLWWEDVLIVVWRWVQHLWRGK